MKFSRVWAMPNKWTYTIKPIKELLEREIGGYSIDLFCGNSDLCTWNNDIQDTDGAFLNHDAIDFLNCHGDCEVDTVLFDPPYSPRQVSECYKKVGKTVNQLTTSARFWSQLKNKTAKITTLGGKVISFGWNSNGMGINRGFEIEEILIVAHGGNHNDTIVTVERKIKNMMEENTPSWRDNPIAFGYCDVEILEVIKN